MLTKKELKHILDDLLSLPSESEWFELKEAKRNFDINKLGKYFSALSNEANLKKKDYAWLVFGVTDKHKIIGTEYAKSKSTLNSLKKRIADKTTNRLTFTEIYELITEKGRVIMFQIPPAPGGMPTAWGGHYFGREHESLAPLSISEIELIRSQKKYDWSAQICKGATIKDLDKNAVSFAREKFKEGNEKTSFYKEIDKWNTATFLNKARLTITGKITKTAILLLGKPEAKRFLYPNARITYVYIDNNGIKQDYEHFDPPFLIERDNILQRIKNRYSKFKILPEDSMTPVEKYRYDDWTILEALNNCIAHQDYANERKIVITEKANYELSFFNSGSFFQGTIEDYIFLDDYTPIDYRNPFLAEAMERLGMIDTIGSGIKKIYNAQKEKFLPLPDYFLGENVELIIYGNTEKNEYTNRLLKDKKINLGEVFLLDKKQKKYPIDDKDYQYVIISYLKRKKRASRNDINKLLFGKLKNNLNLKQKYSKITNLLYKLSTEKVIENIGTSKKNAIWVYKENY